MDELAASALPTGDAVAGDVEFVCLDIETSGLDPATAELLSVGWVTVRHCRIPVEGAVRRIARPEGGVGDSATVHGLTDTAVAAGQPVGDVLDAVVRALAGRILVVHYPGLDKAVLDRLCLERYGCALPVPILDTLARAHARQRRRHHEANTGSLRLADLRAAYGLPRYAAHDCLVDALATAELLLAMLSHEGSGASTRIWPWLTL